MKLLRPSAGQAVYQDFIVAPTTCVPAKRLHCAFTVRGELEPERLEHAVRRTVATHESLRTSVQVVDGELTQVVREMSEITETPWTYVAWDGRPETTSRLICALDDWWTVPRQLAVRVVVGRSPDHGTLIACVFDHANSDGISAELVAAMIRSEYDHPGGSPGPDRVEQFADHHTAMLADGEETYEDWLRLVDTAAPAVPEWMLRRKLAARRVRTAVREWQLAPSTTARLTELTREYLCTPFEGLAACAGLYFRRADGRPAGLGVIHSGRHLPRGFEVAGLLRSYVLDVVDLTGCPDVRAAVTARRTALREGTARFARLPLEEVCRRTGRSPGWRAGELGQWEVELNGMYEAAPTGRMGGHRIQPAPTVIEEEAECENGGPLFLLSFTIGREGIGASLRYVDPPVTEALAERVAADLEATVEFLAGSPDRALVDAPAFFRSAQEPREVAAP